MAKRVAKFTVVVQLWDESERGWGVRPDGWTMHLNAGEHKAYMDKFVAEQKAEYERTKVVPNEYTRPSGSPRPFDVDKKTYAKLKKVKSMWGEGLRPKK